MAETDRPLENHTRELRLPHEHGIRTTTDEDKNLPAFPENQVAIANGQPWGKFLPNPHENLFLLPIDTATITEHPLKDPSGLREGKRRAPASFMEKETGANPHPILPTLT